MSDNAPPVAATYTEEFERFLQNHGQIFKTEDEKNFIRNVFDFASDAHKNMRRYSGAPYISHPFEVAKIVTRNIGLGKTSIAAALLHDIPNKTEYTVEDIERFFGKKIAGLVKGLNKIKNTEYFVNNQEASVFREIILSMSADIRVIFIKIADKLHSIRTVEYLSLRKQERIINEVLNIYAPLAHRLGLFEIKSEMEDLCLKQTNPNIYRDIQQRIMNTEREKLQLINRFLIPIKEELDRAGIDYRIQSRAKSIYSVWKKIKQKRVPFKEVYDLYAVRIIYRSLSPRQENKLALKIAELIRNHYEIKSDRIRNWIEKPRETGYRAYHLTVKSDENIWVEVQIRSEEMHRSAEYGLAAHWRYKGIKDHKTKLDEKIADIIKNLKQNDVSAETFMDDLKLNLFTTEIYVFTPKGQLISLPKHATVLDFAFKIHSSLAACALSAKVNGKVVPLNTELNSGDRVEIIAAEKPNPQKEWFDYITTHKALAGLKSLFREDRKKHQETGRKMLEHLYEEEHIYDMNTATGTLMQKLGYQSRADFYIDFSENKIDKDELLKTLHYYCTDARSRFWTVKLPDRKFKEQIEGSIEQIKTADCCKPVPEDDIVGVYNDKRTIMVHKVDCRVAKPGKRRKRTKAVWASYSSIAFHKELTVFSDFTKSLSLKIGEVLSGCLSVSLRTMHWKVEKESVKIHISIFVKNEEALQELVDKLTELPETTQIDVGSESLSF